MSRVDFSALAQTLLARAEVLLSRWLPGGKVEGRWYVVRNPRRDDQHASLKVNLDDGGWMDWGVEGIKGGDLVALYAYLHGLKQKAAADELSRSEGIAAESIARAGGKPDKKKAGRPKVEVIVPARPTYDPPARMKHKPEWGPVVQRWAYRSAAGVIGYVCRFDVPNEGKKFSPQVWVRDETGKEYWSWRGMPQPYALYNLDRIGANPTGPFLICEGEKSADAGGRLLPDYVATTTPHGSKSPQHGRWADIPECADVLLWRDNDDEGLRFAGTVTKLLRQRGCRVRWLKMQADWPVKFDAADFEAQGRDLEWLRQGGRNGNLTEEAPGGSMPAPRLQIADTCPLDKGVEPWGGECFDGEFLLDRGGVWKVNANTREPICLRPIWVDAMTENLYGAAGVVVKFMDRRWRERIYAFPASKLNEAGGVLGQELQVQDCPVCPGKEKWISRYLNAQSASIQNYMRSVHRLGWVDVTKSAVFVLPHDVLGMPEIPIIYQPHDLSSLMDCINRQGDLGDWQAHVAQSAKGNHFLMFAIGMGLSAALLHPANVEMGGFHFFGLTSGGKTTMLQCAASVWGCGADPQQGPDITSIRKWYSTASGFESVAEAHNDMLLCLDEMEQARGDELGKNIFLLAGGLSKNRSTVAGGLRAVKTWRTMICSSGEKSVAHEMAMVGHEYKGGKAVRLTDIPCDGDDGQRSIITDMHGKSAEQFVDAIKLACTDFYGLAGPVFVGALIAEASQIGWYPFVRLLRDELDYCLRNLQPKDVQLPPEGGRVLKRFAVVMMAMIRARNAGILDWSTQEILLAVRFVRDRWLSNLGEERSEQDKALAHLRDAIVAHESRIVWLKKPEGMIAGLERVGQKPGTVRNVIGFKTEEEYGFTAAGFREICGEFDMRMVLNSLKAQGFLRHEKDKLTWKWPKVQGYDKTRPHFYTVGAEFMGTPDDSPPVAPVNKTGEDEPPF